MYPPSPFHMVIALRSVTSTAVPGSFVCVCNYFDFMNKWRRLKDCANLYERKCLVIPKSMLFIGLWRWFYHLSSIQLKDMFTFGVAKCPPPSEVLSDCLRVTRCRTKPNALLAKSLEGHRTTCHQNRSIYVHHIRCLEFVLKSQQQDNIPPTGTFKYVSLDGYDSILIKTSLW